MMNFTCGGVLFVGVDGRHPPTGLRRFHLFHNARGRLVLHVSDLELNLVGCCVERVAGGVRSGNYGQRLRSYNLGSHQR